MGKSGCPPDSCFCLGGVSKRVAHFHSRLIGRKPGFPGEEVGLNRSPPHDIVSPEETSRLVFQPSDFPWLVTKGLPPLKNPRKPVG